MSVRYRVYGADGEYIPRDGLTPIWIDFVKTSDGTALAEPTIIGVGGGTGAYYFDVDYAGLGAAHVTGKIDFGEILTPSFVNRWQEFRGAATDYSDWMVGYPIIVQLYETGTVNKIVGETVTLYTADGLVPLSPLLTSNADGQVRLGLPAGDYSLVPTTTPEYTWQDLPWTFTVTAAATITQYGTPRVAPTPTDPGSCVVFGFFRGPQKQVLEGTFRVIALHSPDTIGDAPATISLACKESPVTIVDGYAELEIIRDCVVDLKAELTDARDITRVKCRIPDADSVNWTTLGQRHD